MVNVLLLEHKIRFQGEQGGWPPLVIFGGHSTQTRGPTWTFLSTSTFSPKSPLLVAVISEGGKLTEAGYLTDFDWTKCRQHGPHHHDKKLPQRTKKHSLPWATCLTGEKKWWEGSERSSSSASSSSAAAAAAWSSSSSSQQALWIIFCITTSKEEELQGIFVHPNFGAFAGSSWNFMTRFENSKQTLVFHLAEVQRFWMVRMFLGSRYLLTFGVWTPREIVFRAMIVMIVFRNATLEV